MDVLTSGNEVVRLTFTVQDRNVTVGIVLLRFPRSIQEYMENKVFKIV